MPLIANRTDKLKIMARFEPEKAILLAIKEAPHGMATRRYLVRRLRVGCDKVAYFVNKAVKENKITEDKRGSIKLLQINEYPKI